MITRANHSIFSLSEGVVTGAAVAYDAASRGLSVALVEKNDFGWATSAATSKASTAACDT